MQQVKFVVVGHIDHGKSTLIARLLIDTKSIHADVEKKIRKINEEQGKTFEPAYLLDALQEEQEQNITIDITKIEFATQKRRYVIIDAPGHKEFLKNMISGAASAQAAVLLVDAKQGVREQTKRHAYILQLLGIQQVLVVINKMDLVDYSQEVFDTISKDVHTYLDRIGVQPLHVIPVCAKDGENVVEKTTNMPWYAGLSFAQALDQFEPETKLAQKPFRFPVQDVYKFEEKRIIVGRVESGKIQTGDKIVVLPSMHATTVESIELWPDTVSEAKTGQSIGITVADEAHFDRGQVITDAEVAKVRDLFLANVFWMGENPFSMDKEYTIKLATQAITGKIQTIQSVIDSATLDHSTNQTQLQKNDVGTVLFKTEEPLVFDTFADIATTGRFVIVDAFDIVGGGIILPIPEVLQSRQHVDSVARNIVPKDRLVHRADRKSRNGHSGKVIWLTGLPGCGKEVIAQHLEQALFENNRQVYYLDSSNVRFSLSSDLTFEKGKRTEQARRLAELANILVDAGMVVVVSSVTPARGDRALARALIGRKQYLEVFVDTPLEVCKRNDPQGIYSKAEKNMLQNVPGVDVEYEVADYPVRVVRIQKQDFDVQPIISSLTSWINEEIE